jgi:hypothetical protein
MKNTLSNLKKSAVFVALFASASAAYANNSEYAQPINLNAGGAETEVRVDPKIKVAPITTINPNMKNNAAASATGGKATGGVAKVDVLNEGSEFDVSNGGVTGNITDKSKTTNIQEGAELDIKNDLSNGGVTGTITDKSKTDIDASSKNKLTNKQKQEQKTEVDASSNNKLDQKTDVDTSGSGNSDVDVGGNNSSYTSYNKSGAATNIPQAAAIMVTKNCVSSLNVGIGGGNVYAGYGGLSFAYVGSGAVELKGMVTVGEGADAKQVEANYTIPELADLKAHERTPIFDTLRGDDPELATCLMGNYIAQERSLTKAYEQATKVANINADAHVNGIVIQAEAKMFIAALDAKNKIDVQRIITLGEAFNTGVDHLCLANVVLRADGKDKQAVVKETMPLRGAGHESCEQLVWGIYGELTDNAPVAEKPDFTKYLKGKKSALKL